MINFFTSPLEQFLVIPVFLLDFSNYFCISITNSVIILIVVLYLFFHLTSALFNRKSMKKEFSLFEVKESINSFSIIPNRIQSCIELIYKLMLGLVGDNIKNKDNVKYFPLVYFLYLFILFVNLIGLVPFSVTLTSQIIVTVSFSVAIFIGINIIAVKRHGKHFFTLFIPSGTSPVLALILVPIELISYVCKPISLSIRLFANMMAGHTLLKVIAGFGVVMASFAGLFAFAYLVPALILLPLFVLELAVAVIQAFVFSTLICIYLNDALNLH